MDPKHREWLAGLLPDRWAYSIRARRRYAEVAPLLPWIPRGGTVVDVGANRGVYTYWFASRAAVVHSFEPIPHIAATLAATASSNVTVHNVAIGDQRGTARLYVPHEDRESSLVRHSDDAEKVLDVAVVPLDDFGLTPDFVKVDVEGAELSVLAGAARSLAHCPPLYVEIEQRHLGSTTITSVIDRIFAMGYRAGFCHRGDNLDPLVSFDVERDQIAQSHDLRGGRYVHNFLFTDTS